MDWKKLLKGLMFPPLWLVFILAATSTVGLGYVFIKGQTEGALAYGVYALSFYSLSVLCGACALTLPGKIKALRAGIHAHPLGRRYFEDAAFRTHISLHVSLGINLLYVGLNVLFYGLYRSMWFVVLAVYYVILALMRFLLVRYVGREGIGKSRLGELHRTRLCAAVLLLVNFALTGAVMMILYQDKGFEYHGVFIYVMALYTFYSTGHAVADLIKYRKYKSPVMTSAKIIALSAALVSMLSLETAMFSQFGADMALRDQRLMIALTGAGVSVAVIAMAVYMLMKTGREIKEIKINGREN